MESVYGMDPCVAQMVMWFVWVSLFAMIGTAVCFVAGVTKGIGGRA